jgi:hypothetical protein
MKWMKSTRYNGEEIFVNLQQVVYVEAYEEGGVRGSKLHTRLQDNNGQPMVLTVRETPERICVF